ncbi:MAG: 7-cyano-7-deazaguanine synthase QueC [Acidobacteria bacterium]|nr:7-cyano-7-deazaguanine synthase QueC [Acidobacteriota bacterium]
MRAIVLLSGGMDSATALALARSSGREVYTLSFDYGQRHAVELGLARSLSASQGAVEHQEIEIDLTVFGGSALTDAIEVPRNAADDEGIPITYVPARNMIFLSIATAWAEVLDADEIWIGVNAVDYSGYPDCRPEFIEAFQSVIDVGTKSGIERSQPQVIAPLIEMSKAEIIETGTELGLDYSETSSCYDPDDDGACGECDACILRREGFEEAGIEDPTRYHE